jgi:hypothetical protein
LFGELREVDGAADEGVTPAGRISWVKVEV